MNNFLPSYSPRRGDATALALVVRLLRHVFFIAELDARQRRSFATKTPQRARPHPSATSTPSAPMPFVIRRSPQTHLGVQQNRRQLLKSVKRIPVYRSKKKKSSDSGGMLRITCRSSLDRWLMLQSHTECLHRVLEALERPSLPERPSDCALTLQHTSSARKEGSDFRSGAIK